MNLNLSTLRAQSEAAFAFASMQTRLQLSRSAMAEAVKCIDAGQIDLAVALLRSGIECAGGSDAGK